MKIYYAHSMHLYGTKQEQRDIALLEKLGFEVLNPSEQIHVDAVDKMKAEGKDDVMGYFIDLVQNSDAVAFRAHFDGRIPSGVGKEVLAAREAGLPIIELPNLLNSRFMEVGETRQLLELLGQR